MVVFDANILLYAYNPSSPNFVMARGFVEQTFTGSNLVGLSWQVIANFLRLSSNRYVVEPPVPMGEAMQAVDSWLEYPTTQILVPSENYWSIYKRLLVSSDAKADFVMDACLAVLCIEHGGILASADKGFSRFESEGLKWFNPLASFGGTKSQRKRK